MQECAKRKAIAFLLLLILEEEKKKNHSIWTHPYLLRRKQRGMHRNLFMELAFEDPERFRRCLCMNTVMFEELLNKVAPLIQKHNTILRESISPVERVSLTLRHLATGESQKSLRVTYRIGQSTISGIIKEICRALFHLLQEEYLKMPSCENEWEIVANDFGQRWNFYNFIGAMDGKHVKIDPPLQSGSLYYNYKNDFSVVLLAIVDAHLRFIYIDVGTNGRISDSGIWNKCTIKAHLKENTLKIPRPAPLPNTNREFPFMLVEDEGFPLSTRNSLFHIHAIYVAEEKIKEYLIIIGCLQSTLLFCSKNAFGILGARF